RMQISFRHRAAMYSEDTCDANFQKKHVCDPNVWSGRASQEVFIDLSACGLASMYPASDWSVVLLRAIMDISAPAVSLADRPRTGQRGHQGSQAPGRPVLHLVSSSRRPRQGNGDYVIVLSRSVQFLCSCREAVPSSRSCTSCRASRVGAVK